MFSVAWSRDLMPLSLLSFESVVTLPATLPDRSPSQIKAAREKASLSDYATENISRIRCTVLMHKCSQSNATRKRERYASTYALALYLLYSFRRILLAHLWHIILLLPSARWRTYQTYFEADFEEALRAASIHAHFVVGIA